MIKRSKAYKLTFVVPRSVKFRLSLHFQPNASLPVETFQEVGHKDWRADHRPGMSS